MKSLCNIIYISGTFYKLWHNVKKQKDFIDKTLSKDLETIRDNNDGSINDDDIQKITSYYGMGIPAILGTSFAILRGLDLTTEERTASTFLGAMTGLGDDFFDLKNLTEEELRFLLNALLNEPLNVKVKRLSEEVFLNFYTKVLSNSKNHELLKFYIGEVFNAQKKSLKQATQEITSDEIKEITLYKGGSSLLLYRSIFDNQLSAEEKELLYAMGGLMQLGNDIFDVYKDSIKGIKTLATTETNIDKLRQTFIVQMDETFRLAYSTSYKLKNIKSFLRFISMGISRTYVCLDMLEKLQKKSDNVFSPLKYSRKELICDMEKPGNILKSIIYYVRYDVDKVK